MTSGLALSPIGASAQRAIATLLLIAAVLYLVPFVDRGWVPLDEGMIGTSAERVLIGELPHVDYEEPYPGSLSYFYALVFRLTGIDSLHLRWVVFAGALSSLALVYAILRRYLQPVPAAVATWVALGWSFPNYFSTLPSWWILLCALVCLWAVIRQIETGHIRFAIVAGLAVGVAMTIKQTGLYLFPPLVMALMWGGPQVPRSASEHPRLQAAVRGALAVAAVAFVLVIMRSGMGSGEIVYLVVPIAAACAAFCLVDRRPEGPSPLAWRAALIAAAAAALPMAIVLLPHLSAGSLGAFVNGVVVLPQKRLQFTSLPMRPATQIVAAGIALLWVFWSPRSLSPAELRILGIARWVVAVGLTIFALRSNFVYTFLWEAVRGMAALLPVVALWIFWSKRPRQGPEQRVLFASSAILAWASLSQFPFAAPIYFCYVAPLAVITGVQAVQAGQRDSRLGDGPSIAILLLFAVLSLNRGYPWNMGWFHEPREPSVPLDLPRAHLDVMSKEKATYHRIVSLVQQHLGNRGLIAGPDTPEVYYLTGQFSPSGRLFDFFSAESSGSDDQVLAAWTDADVIVLYHGRRFSPPLSASLISKLRQEFSQGESVTPFEVRWR